MPRALNPNLSRGGGLAASQSVEASAFVHPTQGLDSLIAHVVDPRGAHMAQTIAIVDAGSFYSSDDVEGALQEVASSSSSTGQNGLVEGGTYVAVGLNVTLASPTTVRVNGTDRDLSGAVATLADNNTSWLYVNGSTGALTSATGAAPSITSPENVLLAQIVTVAGAITVSRDARWFVRNLDRKLPLTVRFSGTAADRNSEASFESIDAALLYLTNFGVSGVMRNYTLIIKGALVVSTSIVIPVDGVTLQGEDGCVLTTGASLAPLLDVSSRTGIKIRDISFLAAHAASTAIGAPSGGAVTDVLIERCAFTSGASQWVTAIDFNVAGPQTRVVVRDCVVAASSYGIRMREPVDSKVVDTVVNEAGSAGIMGVHLGVSGGGIGSTTDSLMRGTRITGFSSGVFLRGVRLRVTDCAIVNSDLGLQVGPASDDVTVAESTVLLDATNGVVAVSLDGDNLRVVGCRIRSQRASGSYAAEIPVGIDVVSGTDGVHLVGCQVENFLNTTTPGGIGIRFAGTSANSLVDACSIATVETGISAVGATARLRIVGCSVLDANIGMSLQGDTVVGDARISLDSIRGMVGIDLLGSNVQVTGTRIQNPRASGSYGALDVPAGVRLTGISKVLLSGVDVSGFYNSVGSLGSFVVSSGTCSDVVISGGVMETAWTGISLAAGSGRIVTGATLRDFQTGIACAGSSNQVIGCVLVASSSFGVEGIRTTGTDLVVSGGSITSARAVFAGETPAAIALLGENAKIADCLIRGWRNAGGLLGGACRVLTGAAQVTLEGCTIENCWSGFQTDPAAAVNDVLVTGNTFREIDADPILISNSDQVRINGNTVIQCATTCGVQVANSVEIEITNNRILGSATLPTGILLSGTNVAANRCRRFVVSGNVIANCTADGILLSGYVQNGVVTSNTVDGFLPAAQYDPTAVAGIRLASGGATDLVRFVSVAGNTCLRSQSGIVVTGVSATVLVESVTIADNVIHHCCLGTAGTTPAVGIDANWTRNLKIVGNSIARIGIGINDSDVEGAPTSAALSFSEGIRVQGSTVSTITENTIADLVASGGGATSSGVRFLNTATVAAFDARDILIADNQVAAQDGVTETTSGITFDSGGTAAATTVLGLSVRGNIIRRVSTTAIAVSSSGNCSMQQVAVLGNTVSRCTSASDGRGIQITAVEGGGLTDGIIREADVAENTIGDAGDSGIYASVATGGILTGLTIRNNSVSDSGDHAIEVVTAAGPGAFNSLVVSGNTIIGIASEGIYVLISDFSATKIAICDNAVCGTNGAASTTRGISLLSVRSAVDVNDITSLAISGNRIHTTNVVGIAVDLDGALHDAVMTGNIVEVGSVSECLQVICDPVNTVAGETFADNITVTGNTFVGGIGTSFTLDHGVKIRNLTYSDNVHRTTGAHGFVLDIANATVGGGAAVHNVIVNDNAFIGTAWDAVRFYLGDVVTEIDACSDITVTSNRFYNCNTGGVDDRVIQVRALGAVRNLSITNNTFTVCGSIPDDGSGNVDLHFGTNGPSDAATNILVSGNSFVECNGMGIYIRNHIVAAACLVYNIKIDGNLIKTQTNDAIRVRATNFDLFQNLSISHNEIQDVANGGLTSDGGISVFGPSNTPTDQVSIIGNIVRNTGDNNVGGGIQVSTLGDIVDLVINSNIVHDANANFGGIYVTLDGLWTGGSISSNTVSASFENGLSLNATGGNAGSTGIQDVAVHGNSIVGSGSCGIFIVTSTGVSTANLINCSVVENIIETSASFNINLEVMFIRSVSVSRNTVQENAADDGIRVFTGGATFGLTVSENTVKSAFGHGITVHLEDEINGLSVSRNTLHEWSLDTAATSYGGIHLILNTANTENTQAVDISHNILWCSETRALGFDMELPGAVAGMVISGNVVDLSNATNTQSLHIDADTGSQAGLSIIGNTFRRGASGVGFAGTFAPDRSNCSHNTERTGTGAGAGNWAVFTAPFTNSVTLDNQD